jgi:hypothetical protein
MVIVMREDATVTDPRLCEDITLAAYRDAIDYLGFYRDGHGSAIDAIEARAEFAKKVLESEGGITVGIRVNCDAIKFRREGFIWHPSRSLRCTHSAASRATIRYQYQRFLGTSGWIRHPGGGSGATRGLQTSLAQLLFLRPEIEDGKWVGPREKYGVDGVGSGSVLIVHRRKHEVPKQALRSMCRLNEDVVVSLMTEKTAISSDSRRMVVEAVRAAADKYIHVPGKDDRSYKSHGDVSE